MKRCSARQSGVFTVLALGAISVLLPTSCGKVQPEQAVQETNGQSSRTQATSETPRWLDGTQISNQSNAEVRDRWTPNRSNTPVRETFVWFSYGGETHHVGELTEIAVRRVRAEEPGAVVSNLSANITFQVEDPEVLAEVIIGGIMKPSWIVTIGRNMKVLSVRKSFGRG